MGDDDGDISLSSDEEDPDMEQRTARQARGQKYEEAHRRRGINLLQGASNYGSIYVSFSKYN